MVQLNSSQMVTKKPVELISFYNDTAEILEHWKPPSNLTIGKSWKQKNTVVAEKFRLIFGRDFFSSTMNIDNTKPFPKAKIKTNETPCATRQSLSKEFPELITRIAKSKHHTVNSKFRRNYRVTHQTGRKLPVHLQPKVKILKIYYLNDIMKSCQTVLINSLSHRL